MVARDALGDVPNGVLSGCLHIALLLLEVLWVVARVFLCGC